MGLIPASFIDELMGRTDIVEVINARVPLKKAGREYKACCPFHGEKTPSFTVSPNKQFYHCFGCGAHGTALGFLMDFEHLSFPEAVEELASLAGLEVPREQSPEGERRVDLYGLLDAVAAFYRDELKRHAPAVDYLKARGVSGATAATFGLGWAPEAWDAVLKRFGRDEETVRRLATAGLLIERDGGGHYDRFRGRVMFPIRDARGRVIAFGGRVLGKDEPKYLNSPETPLFHKGRELYGLYEARQALRQVDRLLVVEGYMDVVGLREAGIPWAVATLGTATTPEHLERLFRVTEEVVFCFDGDRAGRQAAWRALENTLPTLGEGRQVRFLFLPEGEDPDSLVRAEGAAAFTARLARALPLSDYLHDELAARVDMDSMDGRARLAELAKPLVAKVPEGVFRALLVRRIARAVGMDEAAYGRFVDAAAGAAPQAPGRPARQPRPVPGRSSLVRRAVALVVHFPAQAAQVKLPEGLAGLERPGMDLLQALLADVGPRMTTGGLLERWREHDAFPHLQKLATAEMVATEDVAAAELQDCLDRLEEERIRLRHEELFEISRAQPLNPEQRAELKTLDARLARRSGTPG
ncbi:DNA primase [Thioalkalivibrio sp. XN279]|uniref:DNA primase n=1 Tax=Thioalkalivibrio sp. XN279 TaxID=2714953 RepID=UPI0014097C6C|nr:DNA primase [Thioalkalivibrio sp. XN279]NHA14044.1 DNA primase [Thioalkalivibrio sp. XN279]